MKKSFLVLLGVLAASFGRAVVLSWQVDLDSPNTEYKYAVLYAVTSSGEGNTESAVALVGAEMDSTGKTTGPISIQTDVSKYSSGGYSFRIQMADASKNDIRAAVSESRTWESLKQDGMISGIAPLSPWTDTWKIQAVPEPAAMLLFGLGAAALALRRRRRA